MLQNFDVEVYYELVNGLLRSKEGTPLKIGKNCSKMCF